MAKKQKGVPDRVLKKAAWTLEEHKKGTIRPLKTHGKGYMRYSIGGDWRLVSVDNGENWTLMSHNEYDKFIDR